MPKKFISKEAEKKIGEKVRREFPGCSSLQEIHFYRYLKELEQGEMTTEERLLDDKDRSCRARKELGIIK
ncbi:MAG: hypothetical protein AABY38_02280 [Planctomycetota bacterium]